MSKLYLMSYTGANTELTEKNYMTIGEHAYIQLEVGRATTLYNFFHAQLN